MPSKLRPALLRRRGRRRRRDLRRNAGMFERLYLQSGWILSGGWVLRDHNRRGVTKMKCLLIILFCVASVSWLGCGDDDDDLLSRLGPPRFNRCVTSADCPEAMPDCRALDLG